MTKKKVTRREKAYKRNHYHLDDIITKWCIDNRTYPSKGGIEEQPLPVGYNSNSFKSSMEEDVE